MYSHDATQSKIEALSLVNTQLENDIGRLSSCHQSAEKKLELEIQCLKSLLNEALPGAISVLCRENMLPSQQSVQERRCSKSITIASETSKIDTVDTLIKTVQRFKIVNNRLKESAEEIRGNRVHVADLVSRAAVHNDECASAMRFVDNAQRNTSTALEKAKCNIGWAQQKIIENERFDHSMDKSVNHHSQEIENYGQLAWTGFIPIVNFITMPIMLIGQSHHENKRTECKEAQRLCQAEIDEYKVEEHRVQSEIQRLQVVASQLHVTVGVCANLKRNSETLEEESKGPTDQYSLLITNIGHIIAALDIMDCDTNDAWERYRSRALHCIRIILHDLNDTPVSSNEISRVIGMVDLAYPKSETDVLD